MVRKLLSKNLNSKELTHKEINILKKSYLATEELIQMIGKIIKSHRII